MPDHGGIVWDEIVSFAAILMVIPADALHWILAFVAFRFFDILKPWPIRYFDSRFKNGFGVMFDDVLAAIYAAAVILLGDTLFA